MRTSSTWIEKLLNTHMLVNIGFRLTHVIIFFFCWRTDTCNLIQQWQWVHIPSLDHFSKTRHSVQRAKHLVSQVNVRPVQKSNSKNIFVLRNSFKESCLNGKLSVWLSLSLSLSLSLAMKSMHALTRRQIDQENQSGKIP